jgi:DNA-binding XRE family transcriptional regulator
MINTNKLRGLFAERGFSQAKMAEKIGVTPKTFYNKMDKRVFDSDEIEMMIDVLRIPREDCMDIFFADDVTC